MIAYVGHKYSSDFLVMVIQFTKSMSSVFSANGCYFLLLLTTQNIVYSVVFSSKKATRWPHGWQGWKCCITFARPGLLTWLLSNIHARLWSRLIVAEMFLADCSRLCQGGQTFKPTCDPTRRPITFKATAKAQRSRLTTVVSFCKLITCKVVAKAHTC